MYNLFYIYCIYSLAFVSLNIAQYKLKYIGDTVNVKYSDVHNLRVFLIACYQINLIYLHIYLFTYLCFTHRRCLQCRLLIYSVEL